MMEVKLISEGLVATPHKPEGGKVKQIKALPFELEVETVKPVLSEVKARGAEEAKPVSPLAGTKLDLLEAEKKPVPSKAEEEKDTVSKVQRVETKPTHPKEEEKTRPPAPLLKTGPKPEQIDSPSTLPEVKTQAKVSSPEAKPEFRPVIRLIDLGSARRVSLQPASSRWSRRTGPRVVSSEDAPVLAGSPEFLAPELVKRLNVGVPADCWSLGVLIYVLVSGRSPFLGVSPGATCRNILSGEVRFPVEHFASVTDEACDLTRDILALDPAQRPDLDRVLAHPWFNMKECESVLPIQSLADFCFRRSKMATSTQEVTPYSPHFSSST
ncbi:aurora kinase C-like [Penaeus japonicus]|uniref:aurora kinase C-like n=1 Tax=Penaeus japonicus TaxID=27405 RepID=UPI001C70EBAF|nr:aurora kinase C-like [Penaeus japonicus]